MAGISIGAWKDDHLTHHAVTNHPSHDPDIQLIPFIAFSKKQFEGIYSSFHDRRLTVGTFAQSMIKVQHLVSFMYIPMFKFVLYLLAPLFVIFSPRSRTKVVELLLLPCYYIWFFYALSFLPNPTHRVIYFLLNNVLTSVVFV